MRDQGLEARVQRARGTSPHVTAEHGSERWVQRVGAASPPMCSARDNASAAPAASLLASQIGLHVRDHGGLNQYRKPACFDAKV